MEPPTFRDVEIRLVERAPTAVISPLAVVGSPGEWHDHPTRHPVVVHEGAAIMALATIDAGCERPTVIGARTLVMKQVHLGHDVQVGEDCNIAPGARLGGLVTVGDRVKIGMNAVVKPKVSIGSGAVVGMGAVVTRDVPAGATVVGNPARVLERRHPWRPA